MSLTIPSSITELVPENTYYSLTVEVGIPETYGTIRSQTTTATLLPNALVTLSGYETFYGFDAEENFNKFKPVKTYSQCPNED